MAGYGKLILSLNSGNFMCARNCMFTLYRNASRNALECTEEAILTSKPKRPANSFILYVRSVRSKLLEQNSDMKASELLKNASKEWADLDPNSKKKFKEQYNQNYKVYVQELQEFEDSLTEEQKQLLKEKREQPQDDSKNISLRRKYETFGKPKKPSSAFLLYANSKRNTKSPDMTFKEWLRMTAESWKNVSDTEKKQYIGQSRQLMTQYREDMDEWEKKMMSLGHSDIVRRKTLAQHNCTETEQMD